MRLAKKIFTHFHSDSLYRNASYLMISTLVSSIIGFLFWVIYARIFTAEQIGIATTLIAVSTFIANLSLLGFNNSLIYYLPKVQNKSSVISTSLTTSGIFAFIATIIFILGISFFSPKLSFILHYPFFIIFFIFGNIFLLLNMLSETIFISFRSTKYILIKNTLYSLIKMLLPILLIAYGALGLYSGYSIAIIITAIVALILLYKNFHYLMKISLQINILKKLFSFSIINYFSNLMGMLQTFVIPIMITNLISPRISAYYYIDDLFISFLGIIPGVVTQTLFAEGSHDNTNLKSHVIKSVGLILIILIPAIIVLVFLGKYLLLAFGKEYSTEGIEFLQIVSFSAIFTSINYVIITILNIKAYLRKILFMSIFGSLLMILLVYFALPHGLVGVGYAILVSEAITCALFVIITIKMFI